MAYKLSIWIEFVLPEHLQPGIHVFELKSIIFDSRKQLSINVLAVRVAVPNIKTSFKLVDDCREFPIRCNYLHIATLYDGEGAAAGWILRFIQSSDATNGSVLARRMSPFAERAKVGSTGLKSRAIAANRAAKT
jgi:hypothetical protein